MSNSKHVTSNNSFGMLHNHMSGLALAPCENLKQNSEQTFCLAYAGCTLDYFCRKYLLPDDVFLLHFSCIVAINTLVHEIY